MFIGSLPSTGHGAGHMQNIRYCCEVFIARCVATSKARTTENTAPVLLAACLFDGVYLATGFPSSIA
jgi:hypothetical protein